MKELVMSNYSEGARAHDGGREELERLQIGALLLVSRARG